MSTTIEELDPGVQADDESLTQPADSTGRDARGRFAQGNPGGPGNPQVRRMAEYQNALRDGVTPRHLELVMKRLVQRAVQDGDVQAARLVLDRSLGRVNLDPLGEGIPIELPPIRNFEDLLKTTEVLLNAAVTGVAPTESIEKLAGLVDNVRRVFETQVLAERLDEIERGLDELLGD